jgi:hypothetical protein
MTDSQSTNLSWCQTLIWDPRPIFLYLSLIIFRQLRVCWCGAPSLTRSRVCTFQFLADIASVADFLTNYKQITKKRQVTKLDCYIKLLSGEKKFIVVCWPLLRAIVSHCYGSRTLLSFHVTLGTTVASPLLPLRCFSNPFVFHSIV